VSILTTKKGRQYLRPKYSAPHSKNPGYAYAYGWKRPSYKQTDHDVDKYKLFTGIKEIISNSYTFPRTKITFYYLGTPLSSHSDNTTINIHK